VTFVPLTRRLIALCWMASFALPSHAAAADGAPVALPDSTVLESWTLPNGLRVVTRHVPYCGSVDVTLAYGFGNADDPLGREGLHALLAELEYMGATAEAPERSRGDMSSQRPAGWDLALSPHLTRFSELAGVQQFPGVLHQVATRLRGVTVTAPGLRTCLGAVRADLDSSYRADVGTALYYGAAIWARGGDDARCARIASGKGLQGLNARDLQRQLREAFVPANAVLSIAGNLASVPVRALVLNEFGSIPAGSAFPAPVHAALDSASCATARREARGAAGVVGLFAPALTDSTHPAFLMQLLLAGGHCADRWGAADPPLRSRFQYAVLDDPEIARFYAPVQADAKDPDVMTVEFTSTLGEVNAMIVEPKTYQQIWRSVDWLLGGPLPPELGKRVLKDAGTLHALASGMAARELWGGEPFWSEYRRRFRDAIDHPFPKWYEWFVAPEHRVALLMVPRP
jgi:hypothetical protein